MDKDDQKEGVFKIVKNIENAQKDLIRGDNNESIYYTPRWQFDSKDDEDKDKRDKTIEAFRDGTFSSEHLKKSDDAACDERCRDVYSENWINGRKY